jgi:hypothetical protein
LEKEQEHKADQKPEQAIERSQDGGHTAARNTS